MLHEVLRRVIIVAVWSVLLVRAPYMIRDQQKRPLLWVLAVFAASSVIIQRPFAHAINSATGIAQFNGLVQGVWSLVDISVTLVFVIRLAGGTATIPRRRVIWIAWAWTTAAGMVFFFAITPPSHRFNPTAAPGPFTVYVLLQALYLIATAGVTTYVMCRHLPHVQGRTLFVALAVAMVGDALMIPFMVIRAAERLTPVSPWLSHIAVLASTGRFILLPLGCIIVATEPLRAAIRYWYRRVRLYSLWSLMRGCTPELVLARPISLSRDLVAITDAWVRLHRRVIEIRDSILHLHDTFASRDLLHQAERYAQTVAVGDAQERRALAIACWLEVTRRRALTGAPPLHEATDNGLLPVLLADESTVPAEVRNLRRLRRLLRSSAAQHFADAYLDEHGAVAAE